MDTPERPADPERPGPEPSAVNDPDLDFDQPVAVIPVIGYDPPAGQPAYGADPPPGQVAYGADSVTREPANGADPLPGQPGNGTDPLPGEPAYWAESVPGEPAYGADPLAGEPANGTDPLPKEPAYWAESVPGEPAYGADPLAGQPAYGAGSLSGQPAYAADPLAGQPAYGADSLAGEPVYGYGSLSSQVPDGAVPVRASKPAGPPKSVAGAALLNLTGLGLGYAYLRNVGLVVVALVGSAGLVTTAFMTDAAARPWLWRGVAGGWLVVLAAHAAFLASRRAPGAVRRVPVLAGVAAVAVMVAAYVGYGIAGAGAYDRGVAAQAAGDCATASAEFGAVTGPYELTLSPDVLDAQRRADRCAVFQKAVAAQKRGDFNTAVALYGRLGKGVLAPYAHRNLADTYYTKATSWRAPVTQVDVKVSVDTLLMLRRDFGDTEAGKKAPKAIADLFAAAAKPYGEGKFCDSLAVLGYFAGLDPSSVGATVSSDANVFRARSLYECGLGQARANQYTDAIPKLEAFLLSYPNDGGVPQVKSALITAKVAATAGVQLPFPPPLGGNDPGSVPVTFFNDATTPVTILVAGATAHEIALPACPACPASYPKDDPAACHDRTGRPAVTLHLPPNTTYYYATDGAARGDVTDTINLRPGYEYWQCVYTIGT